MSDFRIKYGSALGPEGTASATSAQNLLPPQDTTPDVSVGTFFVTNNTSAVTYTYFDVTGQGGQVSTSHNGKWIRVLLQDGNTTIQNAGQIFLSDTQGALPSGSTIDLMYYNSAWREVSRSSNSQTQQAAGAAVRSVQYSIGGTAGGAVLNVTTADRLYIVATAAASVVTGFAGGRSNQAIDMNIVLSPGTTAFIAQSVGVLMLPGTDTMLLSHSATYRFVTYNGVEWRMQAGIVSP